MRNFAAILFLVVFCVPTVFAYQACGKDPKEVAHYQLHWVQAGIYQVDSLYGDVEGIICVGISRDYQSIEFFNYRDNFGVNISNNLKAIKQKDLAYISRMDFPSLARIVVRTDHPLTVRIVGESKSADAISYVASLKFLRNVRRSFYAADIRDIRVHLNLLPAQKRLVVSYQITSFDKISLSINSGLNITSVILYDNQRIVERINPFNLPKAKREY